MKDIVIDEIAYYKLLQDGSILFAHSPEENHNLKAGDAVRVTRYINDNSPLREEIVATIREISEPLIIATRQIYAISIERASSASLGGRLAKTLMGQHYELMAAFARSSAHKLPGSKGRLRENALAKFLQVWIPRSLSCPSNVFLTHETVGNFDNEIDLALYDSIAGPMWPFDGEKENWILSCRHTKVVFEVKSTLDASTLKEATKSMKAFDEYIGRVESADTHDGLERVRPLKILFAYQLDAKFINCEFLEFLNYDKNSFDLIIVLGKGAYFAKDLNAMMTAFRHKLTVDEVYYDMFAANTMLAQDMREDTDGYVRATFAPDDTLLALIYAVSEFCVGSDLTAALLSALSLKGSVTPFEFSQPDSPHDAATINLPDTSAAVMLDELEKLLSSGDTSI